jgi:putative cell wall-binding protein
MRRALTPLLLAIVSVVVASAMPAAAAGPVTVTWERNWGSTNADAALLTDGQFRYPTDVAVDKWGRVFVAGGESGDHRIQMFSSDGTFLDAVGTVGAGSALLDSPMCVTTDRWGHVYVGEKGNGQRIHIFNPGLYSDVRTIDGVGTSGVSEPLRIAVALDGTIYLADSGYEIKTWDWFGTFGGSWTTLGVHTRGMGLAHDGNVYTTTDTHAGITNSVIKYDRHGDYITNWGGEGTDPGEFRRPYDVEVDPLERSYVIEAEGVRAQVFEPDGTHLATFGAPGAGDGQFQWPYGIAVGPNRTVYVADTFNHRISKWNVGASTEVAEIEGDTRYTTAVAASQKAYPDPDAVDIVVIATGANWPDALGGAALAGTVNGPLLLTTRDTLPAAVADEIARLEPKRVYVLGGSDVVSDAVMDAAKALTTMNIATRLEGPTRYETAIEIADEVKAMRGVEYDGTAFVCTGENFPDALAASPIAAANGWPIYLTPTAALPASVATAMITNSWGGNPTNHGYIIGGEAVVSAEVEETLNEAPFIGFGRFWGDTRYETAAAVAEIGFEGMGMLWSRPALATGENFPDALAGGVLQGSDYSVMLLTRGGALSPEAAAMLTEYKDHIYEIRFLGGSDVVTPAVRTAARALLW